MWKKAFLELAENFFYIIACLIGWRLLQYAGMYPELNVGLPTMVCVWATVFFVGGWCIETFEHWLFRIRVMKIARQVAEFQGIDPKKLKYKNIRITGEDEDGMMNVSIDYDDDFEEDKK